MSNLFEISKKHYDLLIRLEDEIMEFDAPEQDTIDELNITEAELHAKIEAYYYFIKSREGEIKIIEDEVKRLNDKIKIKETVIERLNKSVIKTLELLGNDTKSGGKQIKTDKLTVWNVYHKPLIVDNTFNDTRFMNYSIKDKFDKDKVEEIELFLNKKLDTNVSIDKTKLKEAINSGEEFDDARINKDASYVRFK
jgi:hypothetical protein